jgi:hypothetical protein
MRVSDELRHLLGSHEATMVQQLLSSKDLHSYLLDLRNQLEHRLASSRSVPCPLRGCAVGPCVLSKQLAIGRRVQEQQLPLGFYQQLHQELEQVGWSNIHGINHVSEHACESCCLPPTTAASCPPEATLSHL